MSGFADSINRSQQHIDSIANSLSSYFEKKRKNDEDQAFYNQVKLNQQPEEIKTKRQVQNAAASSANILPKAPATVSPTAAVDNNVGPRLPLSPAPNAVASAAPASGEVVPPATAEAFNKQVEQQPATRTAEDISFGPTPTAEQAIRRTFTEHPELLKTEAGQAYIKSLQDIHAMDAISAASGADLWIANPENDKEEMAVVKLRDGSFKPRVGPDGKYAIRLKQQPSNSAPKYDYAYWSGLATKEENPELKKKYDELANEALGREAKALQQKANITGAMRIDVSQHVPKYRLVTGTDGTVTEVSYVPATGITTKKSIGKIGKVSGGIQQVKDKWGNVTGLIRVGDERSFSPQEFGLKSFSEATLPTTYKNAVIAIPAVKSMIVRANTGLDSIPDQFGPIQGRLSDLMVKGVGTENAPYAELVATLKLISSKMMQVHTGSRGSELMLQTFTDMLGADHMAPANIKAALQSINSYLDEIVAEGDQYGGNPDNLATPVAPATGNWWESK